jgi:hypothetical protein
MAPKQRNRRAQINRHVERMLREPDSEPDFDPAPAVSQPQETHGPTSNDYKGGGRRRKTCKDKKNNAGADHEDDDIAAVMQAIANNEREAKEAASNRKQSTGTTTSSGSLNPLDETIRLFRDKDSEELIRSSDPDSRSDYFVGLLSLELDGDEDTVQS